MIPDNVTLIVKAPNQQIEDQNIECQSSWTVKQLKGHLSEVYPSKPKREEQKIIYSGQLLEDNTILKDVLRTYESQIAHTMHLVCTPKRVKMGTQPVQPAKDEGIRRRNVPEQPPTEAPRPEMRQNDQNHSVEMQNYFSRVLNNYRVPPYGNEYVPVPSDPDALANHMVMMQQAYVQYMQQYMNMWQAGGNMQLQQPVVATPNEAQVQAAGAAPQAVQAPVGGAPPVGGAQPAVGGAPAQVGGAGGGDELAIPDWLDWTYAASRAAILFSLVYFYSSPFRFLLVVLLCALGYLYQVGFYRGMFANPANNRNQPDNQIPDDNQVGPEPEPAPNQNVQNTQNAQDAQNTQQSLLAVTWMIVASFFTSLIPETN